MRKTNIIISIARRISWTIMDCVLNLEIAAKIKKLRKYILINRKSMAINIGFIYCLKLIINLKLKLNFLTNYIYNPFRQVLTYGF